MRIQLKSSEVVDLAGVRYSASALHLLRQMQVEFYHAKLTVRHKDGSMDLVSVSQLLLDDEFIKASNRGE